MPHTAEPEYTAEQLSAYYLELERFLDNIGSSATHYQVLEVQRAATQEEIRCAYQHALALLYPSYRISTSLPEKLMVRMERAFSRASWAFSVLANFGRRTEYDNSVLPRISLGTSSNNIEKRTNPGVNPPARPAAGSVAAAPAAQTAININHIPAQQGVYTESTKNLANDNRRRCERFRLSVPARITGHDRKSGKWHEMTNTIDVSRTGLTFQLHRRVRHGMVLHLTVPLPVKLRTHSYSASTYCVYGLVRRIERSKQGARVIGIEFIGEHPPAGYLEKPWASFRTGKWGGTERRRISRVERLEIVTVEYFSETLKPISKEMGRTENLSSSGARICVRAAPPEFDIVRLTCPVRGFESFAILRNRYVGKDGFERICVQFMDNKWFI